MALTDLQIRNLKPQSRRYELAIGNGLYVRVDPTGSKAWIYRYTFDDGRRRMSLGQYPGVTLAMARERHGLAIQDIQRGIDPGAKAAEAKAKRKASPTFADLLDEFWAVELSTQAAGAERRRLVVKDALPVWKRRKVSDITRRNAVLLVDKVRERAPVGANRLLGVLARMFNFASERGIIEHSPLTGLRRTKERPRNRVLDDDEISLLWAAMGLDHTDIDMYRLTKLALRMILLTGQRPGEVCAMAWDEIDGALWTIPAGRVKNAEPQQVPLCPMALEAIDQARVYSADSPFTFRSSHHNDRPVTRHAVTKALARHWSEMGIKTAFTPHDLRRTVRTRLAALKVPEFIAERVLGHKLQGIMAVYNQHPYENEKRDALLQWEALLQNIVGAKSGKVVAFRRRNG